MMAIAESFVIEILDLPTIIIMYTAFDMTCVRIRWHHNPISNIEILNVIFL